MSRYETPSDFLKDKLYIESNVSLLREDLMGEYFDNFPEEGEIKNEVKDNVDYLLGEADTNQEDFEILKKGLKNVSFLGLLWKRIDPEDFEQTMDDSYE
ncbi:MAG: hypothetical protein ABEK17_02730 [Candidatus Aenigmatarchaeota archaeon]